MIDLLFIYGTLLQPGNEFAKYLQQHCTYINRGKIKGILYDIGEYPGLVILQGIHNHVHGSIYKLDRPEENLKIIDDYEGVGAGQEQPNLYLRVIKPVETTAGVFNAWIYLYNLSVAGLPQIPSGNYLEYAKQKKSPGN